MENLASSSNTPGTEAAGDLLKRIAIDPASDERYPDGTVLIPADSPDASALISGAVANRRPLALVFPDGADVVYKPPENQGLSLLLVVALLWMADWLRRRRKEPTFVPREWVAEFHEAKREPQPVA
jgi:hypothetical protein